MPFFILDATKGLEDLKPLHQHVLTLPLLLETPTGQVRA
jgi:hypothetical protein